MIRINRLSGELYQNIYISEIDNKYNDLIKYIKKPVHPKFKEVPIDFYENIHKIPHNEIYVRTYIHLHNEKDGNLIYMFDDINYNSILSIKFTYAYLNVIYDRNSYSGNVSVSAVLDKELELIENQTYDICKNFIEINAFNIIFIKESYLTDELIKLAIQKYPYVIRYISNIKLTEDIFRYAVNIGGYCLEFIPDEMKTNEICKLAIENYACAIRYVKDYSEELCKCAVQKDGYMIRFIPKALRTEDMCILAANKNPYIIRINKDVRELNTLEIHKIVVAKYGELLKHIPIEMRIYEVCELACKQNGFALQFVPIEIRTYEIRL